MKTWLSEKSPLITVENNCHGISRPRGVKVFQNVLCLHTTHSTLKKNISFQFTFLVFCDECSPVAAQVRALCCWTTDMEWFSEKSRTAVIYSPVSNPSSSLTWDGRPKFRMTRKVVHNNLFSRQANHNTRFRIRCKTFSQTLGRVGYHYIKRRKMDRNPYKSHKHPHHSILATM